MAVVEVAELFFMILGRLRPGCDKSRCLSAAPNSTTEGFSVYPPVFCFSFSLGFVFPADRLQESETMV